MSQQQGHLDVALGSESGQQVVKLEHEPDVPRTPSGELSIR